MCEPEFMVPVQVQETMVNAAKEEGASVEGSTLDTGHSPYLTKPKETVAWIRRVAGDNL